jgi:hypothetical protein
MARKRAELADVRMDRARWLEERDSAQLPVHVVTTLRALDAQLANANFAAANAREEVERLELLLADIERDDARLRSALEGASEEERIQLNARIRGNAMRKATAQSDLEHGRVTAEKTARERENARRLLDMTERDMLVGYECVDGQCEKAVQGEYHEFGDPRAALRKCQDECVGVPRKRPAPAAAEAPPRQPDEWRKMPLVEPIRTLPRVPTAVMLEADTAAAISALVRDDLAPSLGDFRRVPEERIHDYHLAFTSPVALQRLLHVEVVPLPPPPEPEPARPPSPPRRAPARKRPAPARAAPARAPAKRAAAEPAAAQLSEAVQKLLAELDPAERVAMFAMFAKVDGLPDTAALEDIARAYGVARYEDVREGLKTHLADVAFVENVDAANTILEEIVAAHGAGAASATSAGPLPEEELRLPQAADRTPIQLHVRATYAKQPPEDYFVQATPDTRVEQMQAGLPSDAQRAAIVDPRDPSFEVLPLAGSDYATDELPKPARTLRSAIKARLAQMRADWTRAQRHLAWNLFNRTALEEPE